MREAVLTSFSSSGLRKKVTVFQKEHYSESFIASIILSIPEGAEGQSRQTGRELGRVKQMAEEKTD